MSFFDSGFDANTVAPSTANTPLPEGTYQVVIADCKEKPTKDGTGKYLEIAMQVIAGDHANRKAWDRINLRNKSQQAESIGRAQLSAFCRATGVMQPKSTSDFLGKTASVKIGLEKDDKGVIRNKVNGWVYDAAAPSTAPAAPAAAGKPW